MTILFVGTFPGPVHGMSTVNQEIYQKLELDGFSVKKLNTSPKLLEPNIISRIGRIRFFLRVWYWILKANSESEVLYIALSGGLGQLFDIITLVFARIMKIRIILHHHSFAYLKYKKLITSILVMVAGSRATHIALCDDMKMKLISLYGTAKVLVFSNVTNLEFHKMEPIFRPLRTIGYLSNITSEKGGGIALDMAYALNRSDFPVNVLLAGPCTEPELSIKLEEACSESVIEWMGPVYGEDKVSFFSRIDLLVFPTLLNEAQPLVVWEAMAFGIPVIAYDRGCIMDQVGTSGLVMGEGEDFLANSISCIEIWLSDEELFIDLRKRTHLKFLNNVKFAESKYHELLQLCS